MGVGGVYDTINQHPNRYAGRDDSRVVQEDSDEGMKGDRLNQRAIPKTSNLLLSIPSARRLYDITYPQEDFHSSYLLIPHTSPYSHPRPCNLYSSPIFLLRNPFFILIK